MSKRYILLTLLFIAVGFAAVSTTLLINGSTSIKSNTADFNVYYSNALVNGVVDKSVITGDKTIEFSTTMNAIGNKYVLDYDVLNASKNYDAKLTMNCTGGNEYLSVNNVFNTVDNLPALDVRRGTLTLEMVKSYVGEDMEVKITCTIGATAVERTEIAQEIQDPIEFCESKGYANGRINPNLEMLTPEEEETGDLSAAIYLCEEETNTNFNIYGYDLGGKLVYTYSSLIGE